MTKTYRPGNNKRLNTNLAAMLLCGYTCYNTVTGKLITEDSANARQRGQEYLNALTECTFCGKPSDSSTELRFVDVKSAHVKMCDECYRKYKAAGDVSVLWKDVYGY